MISVLYMLAAAAVLAVAYFLKIYFSGKRFRVWIFLCCVTVNLFLAAFHLKLADTACVMFYECLPRLHDEHPVIAWAALVAMLLHCFAFPVEWELKSRFGRKSSL